MNSAGTGSSRTTLINFITIGLFFALMTFFIIYFDRTEPDIQRVTLMTAADSFATTVTQAHWQWRAEGSPNRILLVDYNHTGKETNRRPVIMSDLGWPRVEPGQMGCAKLWQTVLDIPLQLHNFKIRAEFIDGINDTGKILDSKCRYSLAIGAHFDYWVFTGRVVKYDR